MEDIITSVLEQAGIAIAAVIPTIGMIFKIAKGTKCMLRSDMLQIYYSNRESQSIHQYELENFVALYEAYKAMRGNSFIELVYKEVKTWTVIQ